MTPDQLCDKKVWLQKFTLNANAKKVEIKKSELVLRKLVLQL